MEAALGGRPRVDRYLNCERSKIWGGHGGPPLKDSMATSKNIKVCIVVASIDILGGQAIQALRLIEGLRNEHGIEAELLRQANGR